MSKVKIPADAITFEEYMRKVASVEVDALECAINESAVNCRESEFFNDDLEFIDNSEWDSAVDRARQNLRDKVSRPLREGVVVAYGEPVGGLPIAEMISPELWEHLVFDKCVPNRPAKSGPNDVWCANTVPSLDPRPYGMPRYLEVFGNRVDLDAFTGGISNFDRPDNVADAPGFRNVRVAKEMLPPEERCRIWLREQVAAGGQEKPKFKRGGGIDTAATSYWGEAQSRFGIPKKRFVAIWAEETRGHVAWGKPGRRRDQN